MNIGKFEPVDVRELWKHEQYDFSDWLAKEENITYLNEIVGLTLTDVDKEVYVGSYRCDLVAKDETTDIKVIIENQLEATNHDHLGKIITYASGLDVKVIVWIVKEAREEHKSAIEWLNNNTVNGINFFLIELHAYKIGDSLPAPKFEVVEQPNDFVKVSKINKYNNTLNKTQSERLNFWNQFNETVVARGKPFNIRKANTASWYNVALGTSDAHVTINLVNQKGYIAIEIYIVNNKKLFDKLFKNKDRIENELGIEFDWQRLDNKKASRILSYINELNFDDHTNYQYLFDLIINRVVEMRRIFKNYINC